MPTASNSQPAKMGDAAASTNLEKREHPQRAGYYSLSHDIQGCRGKDGLVAEQEYAQQRQYNDQPYPLTEGDQQHG